MIFVIATWTCAEMQELDAAMAVSLYDLIIYNLLYIIS